MALKFYFTNRPLLMILKTAFIAGSSSEKYSIEDKLTGTCGGIQMRWSSAFEAW
jgi:hypothetical protein